MFDISEKVKKSFWQINVTHTHTLTHLFTVGGLHHTLQLNYTVDDCTSDKNITIVRILLYLITYLCFDILLINYVIVEFIIIRYIRSFITLIIIIIASSDINLLLIKILHPSGR